MNTTLPVTFRHAVGDAVHDPAMWIAANARLQQDLNELGLLGTDVVEFVRSLPASDVWFDRERGIFHGRYSVLSEKVAALRPELVPWRAESLRDRSPAYSAQGAHERRLLADRHAQLRADHERSHWHNLRAACFAMAWRKWPARPVTSDLDRFMRLFSAAELAKVQAIPEYVAMNADEFIRVEEKWLHGDYGVMPQKFLPDAREALTAQLTGPRRGSALGHGGVARF